MVGLRIRPTSSSLSSIFIARTRWFRAPLLPYRPTHTMAHSQAIEEQSLPFSHRKRYYPVEIGQIFNNRYRIIAKIGFGAYSTVWLAYDKRSCAIKIIMFSKYLRY